MHNYKKLQVWQESIDLVTDIYKLTAKFPRDERFGLVSQINRSAVSVPSNIAEGAGRTTQKQFAQFLGYAFGSSYELETQLFIAFNLGYIVENEKTDTVDRLNVIQRKMYKLFNTLNA